MKRIIAFILIASSLLLVACGGGEPTELGFIDPDTGIEYVDVTPMGLYPVDKGEEFISVTVNGEDTVYYEVEFENTSNFLCYEIEGYYQCFPEGLDEAAYALSHSTGRYLIGMLERGGK